MYQKTAHKVSRAEFEKNRQKIPVVPHFEEKHIIS